MILDYIDETSPGIHRYRLNLRSLYSDSASRKKFELRWEEFLNCTPDHGDIFRRHANSVIYSTESFLPTSRDGRTPVLLVFGNPASQSVRSGMCFAFERGINSEHRLWRALRAAGWLSFNDSNGASDNVSERNRRRRTQLLSGRYDSPFLIGVDVFFTFPTPASAPHWSGVAGLATLFGRRAVRLIAETERARLAQTIARFGDQGSTVVAFQRDAYEGLRDASATPYQSVLARAGMLTSCSAAGISVQLFGAPPTRLAHTDKFKEVLRRYAAEIMLGRIHADNRSS